MSIQDRLSTLAPERVLDVGCGSGQFIEFLSNELDAFHSITGVDVDDKALREAGEKFSGENYRFLNAGAQQLPFPDAHFQLVSISKALHHLPDPGQSLQEILRVTEVGRHFLMQEMYRDGLSASQQSHMRYHHLRSEIDRKLGISHHHTFYRADLLAMLQNLDLQDILVEDIQPDDSLALDATNQEEFIGKMYAWLDGFEDREDLGYFRKQMVEIEALIRKQGISRPPMLLILAEKG